MRGDTDHALPGGEITIVQVTERTTIGKVQAETERLVANPRVRLQRR